MNGSSAVWLTVAYEDADWLGLVLAAVPALTWFAYEYVTTLS